ncbi:MAG: hypothetical protein K2I74_05505 [Treponemataceae bacterium]|nr:hypothetical protein [Treponemataceae bacterium]MDE5614089.1 hypothetical protein [Treponemataceae bacterium]
MKRRICIFLLIFVSSLYVCGKKYEARTPWFSNGEEQGAVITKVTIEDCDDGKIVFLLQKEMMPFSPILFFKTTAILENGKYNYSTIDNFGNHAFGYIEKEETQIRLFLDCDSFSNEGKSSARLYGCVETLCLTIEYEGFI